MKWVNPIWSFNCVVCSFSRSDNDSGDDDDVRSWHEKKSGQSHLEFEIYNIYTIYYFVSEAMESALKSSVFIDTYSGDIVLSSHMIRVSGQY